MLMFTHSLSQSPTLCAILIPSAWCHLLPGKTKRDPAPATGAPDHPRPGKDPPWSLASLQQNKSFFFFFLPKEKTTLLRFFIPTPGSARYTLPAFCRMGREQKRWDTISASYERGSALVLDQHLRWEGVTCKERWVWQRRERLSYAKGDEKRPK